MQRSSQQNTRKICKERQSGNVSSPCSEPLIIRLCYDRQRKKKKVQTMMIKNYVQKKATQKLLKNIDPVRLHLSTTFLGGPATYKPSVNNIWNDGSERHS